MRVGRDRGTEQEEGTELGYGGRKEQKCRERIGVEGGKDDWEIKGGREKKERTEGTRYAGVETQAPPAYAAHTPPGTGRRRRPGRSAGSLFKWGGRARRSARVQHQQLVHVRVQPVAALESGQQPRALPEGRVVRQRQAPPRQRGGRSRPGPAGGAEATRRPREAVTAGPAPPPAATCIPRGLIRSPVPAQSVDWLSVCPLSPCLPLDGSLFPGLEAP